MQDLQAPVQRVTLLEDRAFVVRLGRADLPAGVSRWRVPDVAPVLVDKSLTAQAGAARVLNLRVERYRMERPVPPPEDPEAVAERQLARQRLQGELANLDRELDSARRLYSQLLQEIVLEVAWGRVSREQWEQQLADLERWKLELLSRRAALEQELQPPAGAPSPKAAEDDRLHTDLIVELEAAQAGPVEVQLEYAVPGACWRPYHTAVLSEQTLELRCDGCLWQNTGEAWEDVELSFSTQRPSLGAEPPALVPDVLATRKKSQEVVVQQRDVAVQTVGEELTQAQPAAPELPGIDDGGEVVLLRGQARASVRSDGLPVRVELFRFQAPVEQERMLMAERCDSVIVKTAHKNEGRSPLLAGPVDLVREAGLVGRSSVLFVAPGEVFTLGWGPDPLLRAQRVVENSDEEKDDLMGGWWKTDTKVKVTISNLGTEARSVKVIERVPISEVKQVEVQTEARPDANGFVTWQVELPPRGRKELTLAYSLRRRKEVVGI